MADIAILVAEEYERRMKNSRKMSSGGAEATGATTTTTTTTVSVTGGMKAAIEEKLRGLNWVKKTEEVLMEFEPRSQLSVAAFSGLFSA